MPFAVTKSVWIFVCVFRDFIVYASVFACTPSTFSHFVYDTITQERINQILALLHYVIAIIMTSSSDPQYSTIIDSVKPQLKKDKCFWSPAPESFLLLSKTRR